MLSLIDLEIVNTFTLTQRVTKNYKKILTSNTGFTLIETLVGTSILLIVIIGLYGIFQLGLRVANQSKMRITATALANKGIESAKNLPYNEIGTIGGIPPGVISETEEVITNNATYTIKTTVNYIDDPFDGVAPADTVPNDYKKVKVKVSWEGFLGGDVALLTDIAPLGLETTEGGGSLFISVFGALGLGIGQADIHIVNTAVDPNINVSYQTNNDGEYLVAGAPSSTAYEITASKPGYSTHRTYGDNEVTTPEKPHGLVLEGKLTTISFSIDKVSSFRVRTRSPWGSESFTDSFPDDSQVAELSDTVIDMGQVGLATTTEGYWANGYLISATIAPESLDEWNKLSWDDGKPVNTDIKYQLLYATNTNWELIPDSDLSDNFEGFDSSPADLSELSVETYPQIRIKGNLSTDSIVATPSLYSWDVSWKTTETTSIGNVSFNLRGNKIIGTDSEEEPVYKYSADLITNTGGQLTINDIEWDSYTFTIDPAENLDLVETDPVSDPIGEDIDLIPDTTQQVTLMLDAENELLVVVRNSETLEPIFNAQVRLYNNGLEYDEAQYTDEEGRTLFIPLEIETYNLEIQVNGYDSYSGTIYISEDELTIINLILIGPS